jgi:hypothetical protein
MGIVGLGCSAVTEVFGGKRQVFASSEVNCTGIPHWRQNFFPSSMSVPQFGQYCIDLTSPLLQRRIAQNSC